MSINMSKNYSSWTLNSSMHTSDRDDQCKSIEMSTDILSTISALSTDEQKKSIKKTSTVSKRYRKCKHHCNHHRRNKPKKPVTIIREYKNADIQQETSSITANQKSEPKTTTTKGNILLHSIENKLISQRKAAKNETKVEHCSSHGCSQCTPTIINSTSNVQEFISEESCCAPPTTVSCTCTSCCASQSNPIVVVAQPQQQPQQQQQQIFLCSDACSTSTATINQNPLICIAKPAIQQPTKIIIQQQQQPVQVQTQPLQIIQIPQVQASPSIQLVQSQPPQFLQISSATPQVIQTVQVPAIQSVQPQIIQASPQILYQRPYDPVVIPIQNQQVSIAQRPVVALSQPSYAPTRQTQGPHMFEHALVRTIANRVGVPVPLAAAGSPQIVRPLASTASPLLIDGSQPSTSLPIVPLTPGGLLIPFQSPGSAGIMSGGNLMRTANAPSKLNNMEQMRQRLLQRAQVLASLKQPVSNVNRTFPQLPLTLVDPPPVRSVPLPRLSGVSPPSFSTLPPPPRTAFPSLSTNLPPGPGGYPSSNPIVPPTLFGSQTPYTSGKIANTSDTSSSTRSSESSTAPAKSAPSGLVYSQPSFAGSAGGSVISGPARTYQ